MLSMQQRKTPLVRRVGGQGTPVVSWYKTDARQYFARVSGGVMAYAYKPRGDIWWQCLVLDANKRDGPFPDAIAAMEEAERLLSSHYRSLNSPAPSVPANAPLVSAALVAPAMPPAVPLAPLPCGLVSRVAAFLASLLPR